ncbi:MAG TPA: SRPBCC domain-containing protein [Chryseolinea sp.]|nr:SRPBCC domain-containing protein [Chryseolinea sp.]
METLIDYQKTLKIPASAQNVYECITKCIPDWWTNDIAGNSENIGDKFTVRFDKFYKTMLIEDLEPNKKLVWSCIDSYLDLNIKNKNEWTGTRIIWDIYQTDSSTTIRFTHQGLTPEIECYDVCEKGWDYFLNSLSSMLEKGNGNPHVKKS